MSNFDHDYLVMDEFGKNELLCMNCGKKIAGRVERESEKFRGKTSFEFMKHSDYREIPFWLKDGTIAFLMFCDECKNVEAGEEEAGKLSEQLRRARIIDLKSSGKTDEFIDLAMSNFHLKQVIRKLTGDEIRDKFSNKE